MEHPFFSIIIPVYNTERELGRCVDSVIAQSFGDFEVILVDDGSKDRSGAICDQYSAQDQRIRTIHKMNGGCSKARNTGIRTATGEYLLFLDSDDMWDDVDALDKLHNSVQQGKQDIVCFGVRIFREDGSLEKVRKVELPGKCGKDKLSILKELIYRNQYFSACYVRIYRREFLLSNNLFFIDGLLSEDIEWCARVMIHAKTIGTFSGQFYKRIRREQGSQTANLGEENVFAILSSIEQGVKYAKDNCENNELLRLYYEYWAYQYAMLLGFIPIVGSELRNSQFYSRIKALKWLLRYDNVYKVRGVRLLSAILGIKLTALLLSKYYGSK